VAGHLRALLRSTWVPLAIAAFVLVFVFVAVPWYYRTYRGADPERGLSPAEVEWAAAYAPWRTHVGDTLALAYENRTSLEGEAARILERIASCGDDLVARAGTPPTERLRPVLERALGACFLSDGALAQYRGQGGMPSTEASNALLGASDLLRVAEVALRRLLLAQKPLPRRGGRTEESRIEPRLSRAASGDQPTEVLCWSAEEWPQVQPELGAVGLEQDARLRRLVNAYRVRVHVSPTLCEPLVRFAYPGATPDSELVTTEAARALVAVLHASRHAIGVVGERPARCEAARSLRGAAVRLGADRESARRLAELGRRASGCP
jgi:hypothetical protein